MELLAGATTHKVFQSITCRMLVSVLGRHFVSVAGSSRQHLFDLNQLCQVQDSGAKKMMLQS